MAAHESDKECILLPLCRLTKSPILNETESNGIVPFQTGRSVSLLTPWIFTPCNLTLCTIWNRRDYHCVLSRLTWGGVWSAYLWDPQNIKSTTLFFVIHSPRTWADLTGPLGTWEQSAWRRVDHQWNNLVSLKLPHQSGSTVLWKDSGYEGEAGFKSYLC